MLILSYDDDDDDDSDSSRVPGEQFSSVNFGPQTKIFIG